MWRVKTVTKFKNSFFSVLIYWNDNRIHLGIIKKLNFPIWFPPLLVQENPLELKFFSSVLLVGDLGGWVPTENGVPYAFGR